MDSLKIDKLQELIDRVEETETPQKPEVREKSEQPEVFRQKQPEVFRQDAFREKQPEVFRTVSREGASELEKIKEKSETEKPEVFREKQPEVFREENKKLSDVELILSKKLDDDGVKDKSLGKRPKKTDLIDKLVELRKANGETIDNDEREKRRLKRYTITNLEAMIGKLGDKTVKKLNGLPTVEAENKTDIDKLQRISIANMLYKLDVGFMSAVEDLSINYQDHLGLSTNLDGAALELTKHEDELKECFARLYEEPQYKEIINRYMTPTTMLLAINLMVIQKSMAMNAIPVSDRVKNRRNEYKEEFKKKLASSKDS